MVVRLGLNGANGTGTEFFLNLPDNFFSQLSIDTLTSIENVIGTVGPDDILATSRPTRSMGVTATICSTAAWATTC